MWRLKIQTHKTHRCRFREQIGGYQEEGWEVSKKGEGVNCMVTDGNDTHVSITLQRRQIIIMLCI